MDANAPMAQYCDRYINTDSLGAYTDLMHSIVSDLQLLPMFHVAAVPSSAAQCSVCFGPIGASLQHVPQVICSTGGAAASVTHLIQHHKDKLVKQSHHHLMVVISDSGYKFELLLL